MSPARKKRATDAPVAVDATATETCPWCSAKVSTSAKTCPSCGASLRDAVDQDILGVTQIDPAAVSRASRIKPGRLATLLGAESSAESTDLGGHVEPASKEVREEMLRLELAAIDAEIEARKSAAEAEKILQDEGSSEAKPS
jgi:zinc ribbon protein